MPIGRRLKPYNIITPFSDPKKAVSKDIETVKYLSVGNIVQERRHDRTQTVATDYQYEPHYPKKIKYGQKDIEV